MGAVPAGLRIPIDDVFISALAEQALRVDRTGADVITAKFARGQWDFYGPSEVECRRAIQYRQPLEAAFVLSNAGKILAATWSDGYLNLRLEDEDDE